MKTTEKEKKDFLTKPEKEIILAQVEGINNCGSCAHQLGCPDFHVPEEDERF
jgi:hypothetical protein